MNDKPKTIDLFSCLTEKQKARGKRRGLRAAKSRDKQVRKVKNKTRACPACGSAGIWYTHIQSRRLPWWWYLECKDCHWCGKTKLFLSRAVSSWNREKRTKK